MGTCKNINEYTRNLVSRFSLPALVIFGFGSSPSVLVLGLTCYINVCLEQLVGKNMGLSKGFKDPLLLMMIP